MNSTIRNISALAATIPGACSLGCRDLTGSFGFSVGQAWAVPCTDAAGVARALVFAGTGGRGGDCLEGTLDSATAVPDADCTSLGAFQEPENCNPDLAVAPYLRKQVSTWLLVEGEDLVGAGGSSATWTHCTGREDRTDPSQISGDLAVLDGTVVVTGVEGSTATVDFGLDGMDGTIEAQICE